MPVLYRAGEQIDEYNILRLLRQGRMRHSYLARDRRSLQEVVLKFPHETVAGDVPLFKELYFTTTCS